MKYWHFSRWRLGIFLICISTLASTQIAFCGEATGSPKEGEIYQTTVPFGGRYWPLPEGDWEVLAYIPESFQTGRAFRVALASYDQNHDVSALVMYRVGEVGDLPGKDVKAAGECDAPDQPYQGDQQIRDENADFMCWVENIVTLAELPVDRLFDAVRAKLQNSKFSGEYPALQSVIKRNGLVANVFVLLSPKQLLRSSSSAIRSQADQLWLDGAPPPDSLDGTRLSLLLLLREWGIRWQENVRTAIESKAVAGSQPQAAMSALPLPVLQNPNSNIQMLPDMGIKNGDTFSGRIPVGPYLVPLPPGSWKVIIRKPQVDDDGSIDVDQVTLANIDNGALQGVIQLETSLLETADSEASSQRPLQEDLAIYHGPNTYSAFLDWQHVNRDDAEFPLYQELTQQGVAVSQSLIGSRFIFSNRFLELRVHVAFSPNHLGLPDVASQNTGLIPSEWTSFVPQWQRWTTNWGEYLLAGLNGSLLAGAVPAKWRDLDLKNEGPAPAAEPANPDTRQASAVPKEGQIYQGAIQLGERDWPLPEGNWEVLAYSRTISPTGTHWSVTTALAKFSRDRQADAIIIYGLGDVGDSPGSNADTSGGCKPLPAPFLGELEIRNEESDYNCWQVKFSTMSRLPGNTIYDVVRLKLRDSGFPDQAPAIESSIKHDGHIINNLVIVNPGRFPVIPPASSQGPAWSSSSDGLEGTRQSINMMFREWGIRWQEKLRSAFEDRLEIAPLALPVLPDPDKHLPMVPDLGLKQDMSFSSVVPIGPFQIPLPPGIWKVIIHDPQLDSSFRVGVDHVTLANIQDGVLHGLVQIEAQLVGSTIHEMSCKSQRSDNLATYHGPDEYCAFVNPLPLDPNDKRTPFFKLFNQKATGIPNTLIGSVFAFSNKLIRLSVYVEFAPSHVGLKDVQITDEKVVPTEWASFVPKWRAWTRDWAKLLLAGLTGEPSMKGLLVQWRDVELKSIAHEPSVKPQTGKTYVGTFDLGGRNWPLPPGSWILMASTPHTEHDQTLADEVLLAQITKNSVSGIISLIISRPDVPIAINEPTEICKQSPSYYDERVRLDLGSQQDCWSFRIAPTSTFRQSRSFEAFEVAVRAQNLPLPEAFLHTGFAIVDRDRLIIINYCFPAAQLAPGLSDTEVNDLASWSVKRGPIGPIRTAAFSALQNWSRKWHDIVRLGFDGKLKAGRLPEEWAHIYPRADQAAH